MSDTYDVASVRALYPALASGEAFFDGPGGTQVPRPVVDAVATAMASPVSNRGQLSRPQRAGDAIVADCRAALADLLAADPDGVVYGRSMTDLTYDFSRALARTWSPGDEVVVSRLDHDGNVRPWVQAAEAVGATVRWIDFDPVTTELREEHLAAVLSERTRLVAFTAASNVLGTRPDVPTLVALAHETGALTYVDGVHHAAHVLPDLAGSGADFYALLAVQVRRSALRCRGRGARAARGAAARQAAPLQRPGARAVRAGHAPLRAAGRRHGRRRLPRLARPDGCR